MAKRYNPASLPEVDAVEIVDLSRFDEGGIVRNAPSRRVEGENAQVIADLWRQLPSGVQKRCHIPPFALRFLRGKSVLKSKNLLVEASICWECNNIYAAIGKERLLYEFDAEHEISQKLLVLLKELMQ